MTGNDHDVEALRRERDDAIAHARTLEHELGAMRGKVKRFERTLWRRTVRRQRVETWARRLLGMLPGR